MNRLFFIFAAIAAAFSGQASFAQLQCPKVIRVQVDGLKSTSAKNTRAIEQIYTKGEKQTNKDYIAAALAAVNRVESLTDVLRYSPSLSSAHMRCGYKGKNSRLIVSPIGNEYADKGYIAALAIGSINYKSPNLGGNPSSHVGYAADLISVLKDFNKSEIQLNRSRAHYLNLDLLVQVPLGDYGTDGYDVDVKIGQAASVRYSIVE
jgi:hypothetical protein